MKTLFLLMAQYEGHAIVPLEKVCADYFSHLTPAKMKFKVASGQIDLPIVPVENSQKSARGVFLTDLAAYLDAQHLQARTEHEKLMGRHARRPG
jgi:prephenate dehydratase